MSQSGTATVYAFRFATAMMLLHTIRRHSSLLNSPSDSPSGHIIVPRHEGARALTEGQFCSREKAVQLQPILWEDGGWLSWKGAEPKGMPWTKFGFMFEGGANGCP